MPGVSSVPRVDPSEPCVTSRQVRAAIPMQAPEPRKVGPLLCRGPCRILSWSQDRVRRYSRGRKDFDFPMYRDLPQSDRHDAPTETIDVVTQEARQRKI